MKKVQPKGFLTKIPRFDLMGEKDFAENGFKKMLSRIVKSSDETVPDDAVVLVFQTKEPSLDDVEIRVIWSDDHKIKVGMVKDFIE